MELDLVDDEVASLDPIPEPIVELPSVDLFEIPSLDTSFSATDDRQELPLIPSGTHGALLGDRVVDRTRLVVALQREARRPWIELAGGSPRTSTTMAAGHSTSTTAGVGLASLFESTYPS